MLLLLVCVQPRRKYNLVLGVTRATRPHLAVVFVYTDRYPSLADILGKLLPFRAAQANLVALEVEMERATIYQFACKDVCRWMSSPSEGAWRAPRGYAASCKAYRESCTRIHSRPSMTWTCKRTQTGPGV